MPDLTFDEVRYGHDQAECEAETILELAEAEGRVMTALEKVRFAEAMKKVHHFRAVGQEHHGWGAARVVPSMQLRTEPPSDMI